MIRYDNHGVAMRTLYDADHASDDEDDEDDEGDSIPRTSARSGSWQTGDGVELELTTKQKERMEKDEQENQLLEFGDSDYFDLGDEIAALALVGDSREDASTEANEQVQEVGGTVIAEEDEQLQEIGGNGETVGS